MVGLPFQVGDANHTFSERGRHQLHEFTCWPDDKWGKQKLSAIFKMAARNILKLTCNVINEALIVTNL